ncbi:hypothetical protein DMB66_55180 [Actinoplanes sp. ATCC 53533]|uniref:hypothetical protein n=1 Tax=Actinoplanes sp. ATCC 53533 TaxID=1288362 RepID=UPI000F7A85A7|nr:hypothetical protein [Actinoplanes sp. ATCC 53533]RSM42153.1 hypothetical protein DMB66_55180 [Actinoplanes sp. ATCC 53533]
MTNGMIMVQWADLTGRGFSPHDVGPTAPREYWAAAERLLQADLSQPPEGIRSTAGHPIWTLRRVHVQGRWLWCFVVQGRRGPFGVAGTCRFAFAAENMSALEAWTAGVEIAAGDQKVPAIPYDADRFQHVVMQLLGGIVTKQAAIPVDGDPAQTATIIPAALKVLPERELRSWSWSTCMLQRPDSAELRVVSGGWPDDFRREEPHRADTIDQWFRGGPVSEEQIKNRLGRDAVRRGFEFLVHYASTGKRPDPELLRGGHTLDEMLVELGHANHVPEWHDVPSMLETPGGRRRLAEGHLPLVTQWAAREPAEAVCRLREELGAPLAEALLTGVVDAQDGTPDNLLGLPTASRPELTAWHDRLATLLLSAYPQPKRLRAVTEQWISRSGVLGGSTDRVAARPWLQSLGLTTQHDSEYFPPDARIVVSELNTHLVYTQAAHDEVLLTTKPLRFLGTLTKELHPLPSQAVGTLLALAAMEVPGAAREADMLQHVARDLTHTALQGRCDEPWIDAMLETVQQHLAGSRSTRLQRMMYGALEALLAVDAEAPRTTSLRQRCRAIGYDNNASSHVATALKLAGGPAPATQPLSWGQDTGSHRIITPRGPAGTTAGPIATWRSAGGRLRRRFSGWSPVYIAGAAVAVAVLGSAGAFLVIRMDGTAPERPLPTQAAVASTTGVPLQSTKIPLPPRGPREQTSDDRRKFLEEFRKKVPSNAVPSVIILVSYGGDPLRAEHLKEALGTSQELTGVPVQTENASASPAGDAQPGWLIGTVHYNR